MKVIELINKLQKQDPEEEIFISYSEAGEVLVPVDVSSESGVLDPNFASAFIYAEEITVYNESFIISQPPAATEEV